MKKEKIENLLTLIKENPDLRIVPMVDADIIGEDFGWYMGVWGSAMIDYFVHGADTDFLTEERVYFYENDRDDVEEEIEEAIYANLPTVSEDDLQQEVKKEMKEIKWEKVIAVNITTP